MKYEFCAVQIEWFTLLIFLFIWKNYNKKLFCPLALYTAVCLIYYNSRLQSLTSWLKIIFFQHTLWRILSGGIPFICKGNMHMILQEKKWVSQIFLGN